MIQNNFVSILLTVVINILAKYTITLNQNSFELEHDIFQKQNKTISK
jgi:hypothetical protein